MTERNRKNDRERSGIQEIVKRGLIERHRDNPRMASDFAKIVQEQEDRFGLLAKRLVDIIWVVDLETQRYVYISPTVEGIRGYTVEEVMASTLRETMTTESYDQVVRILVEGLDEFEADPDVAKTLELETTKKDGTTLWMEVTARFYRERDGSIRMLGVSKDIDDRKRFEVQKDHLIRELEEAVREKNRLLKENKILYGLLPICAQCKKIRDEHGQWWHLEKYISMRTNAEFTHTVCPDCLKSLYPEASRRKAP